MTPEQKFERDLKVFSRQVAEATQCWFTRMALNHVAARNQLTLRALNVTPLFWNTVTGALQFTAIVAVGRIFDDSRKSPRTIATLLNLARDNRAVIFSKAALEARKRRGSANADEWIDEYMADVHVPTLEDFNRLGRLIRRHRKTYQSQYEDIRHKHLAHTEITDDRELQALYSKASRGDLERLIAFLNQFDRALWGLFHNGRRPRLKPVPSSSARLIRRRFNDPRQGTAQERSFREARMCLRLVTEAVKARR